MLHDGILPGQIALKCMSVFMRDHVYVAAGSVKVCKDKGRMILVQIGHIAALFFILSAEHIEELILHHEIEKFFGFGGQLRIHLLSALQNFLCSAHRIGIAFFEVNLIIDIRKLLQTEALSSDLVYALRKRYEYFLHLSAEILDIVSVVAVTVHSVVAQLDIIVIAHRLCLRGAVFYQLVINVIQFIRNCHKVIAVSLPCLSSYGSVVSGQIGTQQGQIAYLPVKRNLRGRDQLIVLSRQRVFLLHQADNAFIHTLDRIVHRRKGNLADLFFHKRTIRRFVQGALIIGCQTAQHRRCLIVIILFCRVKRICGIAVVTDFRNRHGIHHILINPIIFLMDLPEFFSAFCFFDPFGQSFKLLRCFVIIDPFIGHVFELHTHSPFP